MGTIYKCCCNACSNDFTIYDGDGMHSIGLICIGCGKRSSVPRCAPRPPREGREVPSFLQTSRFYSLPPIPDMEIRRFTDEEFTNINQLHKTFGSEGGDRWDGFEITTLIDKKNPCLCGGTVDLESKTSSEFAPNSNTRCPKCNSKNFNYDVQGNWD
jgi:hypothetical protein